jgi:hypothetical protein
MMRMRGGEGRIRQRERHVRIEGWFIYLKINSYFKYNALSQIISIKCLALKEIVISSSNICVYEVAHNRIESTST